MKHPTCKCPDNKCPNMETQDNTCLLRNPFDCPMKPEDRLLTDEEIQEIKLSDFKVRGKHSLERAMAKAQDAKTASIIRAERLDRPELREKIARIICCFAAENENCDKCEYNIPKTPFPDCFPDIRVDTNQLIALIPAVPQGDESGLLTPEAIKKIESDWFATPVEEREDPEIMIAKAQQAHTASIYEAKIAGIFEEIESYITRNLEWANEENEMMWKAKLEALKSRGGK